MFSPFFVVNQTKTFEQGIIASHHFTNFFGGVGAAQMEIVDIITQSNAILLAQMNIFIVVKKVCLHICHPLYSFFFVVHICNIPSFFFC